MGAKERDWIASLGSGHADTEGEIDCFVLSCGDSDQDCIMREEKSTFGRLSEAEITDIVK